MATRDNSKKDFNFTPYVISLGILALVLIIYAASRFQTSGRHLVPISVYAIIAGVLFESKRLSDKWQPVLLNALASFAFSFLAFLPGKHESNYNLETHIEMWPYWFIIIFAIGSIAFHGDKIVPKLTEGITLLQSLAAIYWVIDYGFINTDFLALKLVMAVGLLFSFYSIFHAFTNTELSATSRLTLSIWSSIIMLLFASDNIYRVYQNEQIENTADITHGLYIGLQYFLLGISCIYVIQNFLMLAGFLPGKGSFFNDRYFQDIRQLKKDHVNRYSDRQVSILHSLFCLAFTGGIFALNFHFQILPRHVAIWAVFVIFPYILLFTQQPGIQGRRY